MCYNQNWTSSQIDGNTFSTPGKCVSTSCNENEDCRFLNQLTPAWMYWTCEPGILEGGEKQNDNKTTSWCSALGLREDMNVMKHYQLLFNKSKVTVCKAECADFLSKNPGDVFEDYRIITDDFYLSNGLNGTFRWHYRHSYPDLYSDTLIQSSSFNGIYGKCQFCQLHHECLHDTDCQTQDKTGTRIMKNCTVEFAGRICCQGRCQLPNTTFNNTSEASMVVKGMPTTIIVILSLLAVCYK